MFIHWIKSLYTNIESTVINNGHTSDYFKISRGIRQGCPISPYLFIIAVEVMAIYIRQDKTIKGIWVGKTELKLSQLADDTSMFILDIESIKNLIKCLDDFHKVSGLKMNVEKTIAKPIGSLINTDISKLEDIGITWTKGPITTLGITITNNLYDNIERNFKTRLKAMRDLLNIWLTRNLSLKGKITVLKSLALPKLLYVSTNVPVPTEVLTEAEEIISNFLWNHKRPKLKRNVIIQPIESGGLKAPDIRSMIKASKVAWVKRLNSHSKAKWKNIFQEIIPISIKLLIETNLSNDAIEALPPFYRQVLSSWNEIKQHPEMVCDYLEQVLWNNELITTPVEKVKQKNKTSIFYQDLYRAGIHKLKDLISDHGDFMDFGLLTSKYNVRFNILRYQKLKLAIPKKWLLDIKTHAASHNSNSNHFRRNSAQSNYVMINGKEILKCSTKVIYNCFIDMKKETPTALAKWESILEIENNDWEMIFKLPYTCCKDTALQSFQYRIIQRIFPCNKWFHNLTVINSDICEHCDISDTIEHHLFYCKQIGNFWIDLQNWYNESTQDKVHLTCKHVVFGIYYDNIHFSCINYIILLAKMFIYRQKYNDSQIDIIRFLIHLYRKLEIERKISEKTNNTDAFHKRWSEILKLF